MLHIFKFNTFISRVRSCLNSRNESGRVRQRLDDRDHTNLSDCSMLDRYDSQRTECFLRLLRNSGNPCEQFQGCWKHVQNLKENYEITHDWEKRSRWRSAQGVSSVECGDPPRVSVSSISRRMKKLLGFRPSTKVYLNLLINLQ